MDAAMTKVRTVSRYVNESCSVLATNTVSFCNRGRCTIDLGIQSSASMICHGGFSVVNPSPSTTVSRQKTKRKIYETKVSPFMYALIPLAGPMGLI